MARLGTNKNPAHVVVKTKEKAQEIQKVCDKNGWNINIEIKPNEEEDTLDYEKLQNPIIPVKVEPKIGRNEPCPCGSGKKYKKCCGKN